jgi:hypothetical protein
MSGAATIEGDYRYTLQRGWTDGWPWATFIMLNPSTADADTDDPTIRRCIGFAQREGCAGLRVVNLYALRATDPRELWKHADPVGPLNDFHLRDEFLDVAYGGGLVIAAWGAHARPDRVAVVRNLAAGFGVDLHALGFTKAGQPRHPLYLRGDAPLVPWGVS